MSNKEEDYYFLFYCLVSVLVTASVLLSAYTSIQTRRLRHQIEDMHEEHIDAVRRNSYINDHIR